MLDLINTVSLTFVTNGLDRGTKMNLNIEPGPLASLISSGGSLSDSMARNVRHSTCFSSFVMRLSVCSFFFCFFFIRLTMYGGSLPFFFSFTVARFYSNFVGGTNASLLTRPFHRPCEC